LCDQETSKNEEAKALYRAAENTTTMGCKAKKTNFIPTYIPWIHNCVTKTTGYIKNHKYTNIHNFYSVKNCKHFKKQYHRSHLHINNSSAE
jgi:hypothetical protein